MTSQTQNRSTSFFIWQNVEASFPPTTTNRTTLGTLFCPWPQGEQAFLPQKVESRREGGRVNWLEIGPFVSGWVWVLNTHVQCGKLNRDIRRTKWDPLRGCINIFCHSACSAYLVSHGWLSGDNTRPADSFVLLSADWPSDLAAEHAEWPLLWPIVWRLASSTTGGGGIVHIPVSTCVINLPPPPNGEKYMLRNYF